MILVDTSVWIDHLRRGNAELAVRLEAADVWSHPFVIGELACGNLKRRSDILASLATLPLAPVATHQEVMTFVDASRFWASGIGWIDAHLLASSRLAHLGLWTLDRALALVARRLGVLTGP